MTVRHLRGGTGGGLEAGAVHAAHTWRACAQLRVRASSILVPIAAGCNARPGWCVPCTCVRVWGVAARSGPQADTCRFSFIDRRRRLLGTGLPARSLTAGRPGQASFCVVAGTAHFCGRRTWGNTGQSYGACACAVFSQRRDQSLAAVCQRSLRASWHASMSGWLAGGRLPLHA